MQQYTELTLINEISVTECVQILDDASAMGFEIIVADGKIYYRENEN